MLQRVKWIWQNKNYGSQNKKLAINELYYNAIKTMNSQINFNLELLNQKVKLA